MAKGRWWRFYFYFTVLLTECAVAAPFWTGEETPMLWKEWLDVPLYLLQAVSLFGFVYSHRIASQTAWKTLFVVTVGYEIWSAYDMATDWDPSTPPVFIAFVVAMGYFTQIPLWYGNFLYGFRCKELWGEKT